MRELNIDMDKEGFEIKCLKCGFHNIELSFNPEMQIKCLECGQVFSE